MPKKLVKFKGYTVDFRLKQFRKVNNFNKNIEFVDFESEKGRKLLKQFLSRTIIFFDH